MANPSALASTANEPTYKLSSGSGTPSPCWYNSKSICPGCPPRKSFAARNSFDPCAGTLGDQRLKLVSRVPGCNLHHLHGNSMRRGDTSCARVAPKYSELGGCLRDRRPKRVVHGDSKSVIAPIRNRYLNAEISFDVTKPEVQLVKDGASQPHSLNPTGTISRRHLAHFVSAVDRTRSFRSVMWHDMVVDQHPALG